MQTPQRVSSVRKRPEGGVAGSTWVNQIVESLANKVPSGSFIDGIEVWCSICRLKLNGTDSDGNLYDIYSIDDAALVSKINTNPVKPKNSSFTLAAFGEVQLDSQSNFILVTWGIGSGTSELVEFTAIGGSGTATASWIYTFNTADGATHSSIVPANAEDRSTVVDLLAAAWGIWFGRNSKLYVIEGVDWATCASTPSAASQGSDVMNWMGF